MHEANMVRKSLCRILLLLLGMAFFTCGIIPDRAPFLSISTLVLLTLGTCFFHYCSSHVSRQGIIKKLMLVIAALLLLLILLRGIKYSAFTEAGILARHTWYLYYIPILLIPQFLLMLVLCIHTWDGEAVLKKWAWTFLISAVFLLLVLTNDLHQLIFRFLPQFHAWDEEYSHGLCFYLLTGWEYTLYFLSVSILHRKCRYSPAKRYAYLILLVFLLSIAMQVMIFTGTMPKPFGTNLVEFPETVFFMVTGILTLCMSLGLIPTNEYYGDLMQLSSIAAQITDTTGTAVYQSAAASELPPTLAQAPGITRLDENTLLRKKVIPGGYGFWQEDVTELNRVNTALEEAKTRLKEEGTLLQLQNQLQEKQRQLEQRIQLYDEISRCTVAQSKQISNLALQGLQACENAPKQQLKKHILLLGAYIKRYANLMILGDRCEEIYAAELGLSFAESLHYLNYYGVPGSVLNAATGKIPVKAALTVFSFYETVLERCLNRLKAVYVSLTSTETGLLLKLNFEGTEMAVTDGQKAELLDCGFSLRSCNEDGITYLSLTLPKEGETA